jgi:hypothetical protein
MTLKERFWTLAATLGVLTFLDTSAHAECLFLAQYATDLTWGSHSLRVGSDTARFCFERDGDLVVIELKRGDSETLAAFHAVKTESLPGTETFTIQAGHDFRRNKSIGLGEIRLRATRADTEGRLVYGLLDFDGVDLRVRNPSLVPPSEARFASDEEILASLKPGAAFSVLPTSPDPDLRALLSADELLITRDVWNNQARVYVLKRGAGGKPQILSSFENVSLKGDPRTGDFEIRATSKFQFYVDADHWDGETADVILKGRGGAIQLRFESVSGQNDAELPLVPNAQLLSVNCGSAILN